MIDLSQCEEHHLSDVQTLVDLWTYQDPRTIEEMIEQDTEFEDHQVEKVTHVDNEGSVEVRFDSGWCAILRGAPIKAGDQIRLYGRIGHRRYGWALNGQVIEYETPWERFAERIAMLAGFDRRRREEFITQKADIDRWVAELRSPYRDRVEKFRSERSDFDINGGAYEIYVVLMAQRIDNWCNNHEDNDVDDFQNLDYEDQKLILHAGEEDKYGISGFQFDCAVGLARAVREGVAIS